MHDDTIDHHFRFQVPTMTRAFAGLSIPQTHSDKIRETRSASEWEYIIIADEEWPAANQAIT
jgi:hypothetical protein